MFFITNNNTISRENFLKKFDSYGIKASKTEIYTAAFATAYYMKHIVKFDKKVYMIGGKGLSEELTEAGIPNIGYGVIAHNGIYAFPFILFSFIHPFIVEKWKKYVIESEHFFVKNNIVFCAYFFFIFLLFWFLIFYYFYSIYF